MEAISRTRRSTAAALCAASLAALTISAPASASGPEMLVSLRSGSASITELTNAIRTIGGSIVDTFEIAGAAVVRIPSGTELPDSLMTVPSPEIRFASVSTADAVETIPGTTYRSTIRAGASTGAGVTVAVVDTGVADVPGVNVSARVNLSGGSTGDGLGHGTFMAGLIAGNGQYPGVAPGASVFDVQVADETGATDLRRVLAGLDAVADRAATDSSLKVLNLSLSSGSPLPPSIDPLTRALDRLWDRGITVVVPSGNDGAGKVSSPGVDPTLLTVGAINENGTASRSDDFVAPFSGYGSRFGAKPDIVAPGVSLVSLRSPGSIADVAHPGSRVGENYFRGTGTSMATAVTSGAAAVLVADRGFSPNVVKGVLMKTAYANDQMVEARGEGQGALDLGAARIATPTRANRSVSSDSYYGPRPEDEAAWADFADAWARGDLNGVVDAWRRLSPQGRRWAANAWGMAITASRLTSSSFDRFEAEGRNWSTSDWNGRNWATDEWVGRNWSANGTWIGRNWSAADGSWAGRNWSWDEFWAGRNWSDTSWSGRNWVSADWLARAWVGRNWTSADWAKSAWADQAWSGRNWSSTDWYEMTTAGRSWATSTWQGRNWSGGFESGR